MWCFVFGARVRAWARSKEPFGQKWTGNHMSFSTYSKQREFSAESLKARVKPVLHGPLQRAAQAERRRSISEGQHTALYHQEEKSAEEILADEIRKKDRERMEKARAQIMEANKRGKRL